MNPLGENSLSFKQGNQSNSETNSLLGAHLFQSQPTPVEGEQPEPITLDEYEELSDEVHPPASEINPEKNHTKTPDDTTPTSQTKPSRMGDWLQMLKKVEQNDAQFKRLNEQKKLTDNNTAANRPTDPHPINNTTNDTQTLATLNEDDHNHSIANTTPTDLLNTPFSAASDIDKYLIPEDCLSDSSLNQTHNINSSFQDQTTLQPTSFQSPQLQPPLLLPNLHAQLKQLPLLPQQIPLQTQLYTQTSQIPIQPIVQNSPNMQTMKPSSPVLYQPSQPHSQANLISNQTPPLQIKSYNIPTPYQTSSYPNGTSTQPLSFPNPNIPSTLSPLYYTKSSTLNQSSAFSNVNTLQQPKLGNPLSQQQFQQTQPPRQYPQENHLHSVHTYNSTKQPSKPAPLASSQDGQRQDGLRNRLVNQLQLSPQPRVDNHNMYNHLINPSETQEIQQPVQRNSSNFSQYTQAQIVQHSNSYQSSLHPKKWEPSASHSSKQHQNNHNMVGNINNFDLENSMTQSGEKIQYLNQRQYLPSLGMHSKSKQAFCSKTKVKLFFLLLTLLEIEKGIMVSSPNRNRKAPPPKHSSNNRTENIKIQHYQKEKRKSKSKQKAIHAFVNEADMSVFLIIFIYIFLYIYFFSIFFQSCCCLLTSKLEFIFLLPQ